MGMDQELYRFRAIIGHQGPLLASDPDWKGSKYNVQVEWETGEITFDPLSIIAADDPVTCAAYAKENDLLALEGWRRFRSLAKKDKGLARAIKQSKIRQVRRSQTYMFGYLIPRNYMEAMQFDSENKNRISFEPLSIIAADDPVTCAAYAKENDLLALEGWRRFRSLAKKDKVLARAIKQSKIRQVMRSQTYMFGYLIPRSSMEAMQFDSENKNSKWYDAIKLEMESMSEYKVFKK